MLIKLLPLQTKPFDSSIPLKRAFFEYKPILYWCGTKSKVGPVLKEISYIYVIQKEYLRIFTSWNILNNFTSMKNVIINENLALKRDYVFDSLSIIL